MEVIMFQLEHERMTRRFRCGCREVGPGWVTPINLKLPWIITAVRMKKT